MCLVHGDAWRRSVPGLDARDARGSEGNNVRQPGGGTSNHSPSIEMESHTSN